jgi:hypothetical protein
MALSEILRLRMTMLLVWLSLAAGFTYLFIFEPGKSGFFPICPFRALTGLQCPGCGSTRGLYRLLHGDVVAAFELNPLFVLSLPFLVFILFRYTNAAIRSRPIKGNQVQPKYLWALFVVIMTFWVFRNTPFYPFVS